MRETVHVQADRIPASYAQRRMWFLEELLAGKPLYNILQTVSLKGELQESALQAALQDLVDRHEALRTTFGAEDGEVYQEIHPELTLSFERLELLAEQRTAWLHAEARTPFDLQNGPLMRTFLLSTGENEHCLVLSMHHIVTDGWSMSLLMRELMTAYEQRVSGRAPEWEESELQYADYSEWQREWLQGDTLEWLLGYWKQHLQGLAPLLPLPTDYPRPAVPSYSGGEHRFTIPQELAGRLRHLSTQERVSLYMTLLTAFKVMLCRYTGQADLAVGTPIANRNHDGIQSVQGCFVNTLVLRSQIALDQSFRANLHQVEDVTLAAYEHQDLPFELLVDQLRQERDASYSPLFQVMFVLQNTPPVRWELPELTVEPIEVHNGTAKFDLVLTVVEDHDQLVCAFEYSRDLFEAATVERMASHYLNLLQGAVSDAETPVSRLPILSEAEQKALVPRAAKHRKSTPAASEGLAFRLFEAQAERVPDHAAVVYEDRLLTYRELNEHANRLAHHLRGLGVGRETLVGISLERSLDVIVAILGVLKAGGAYVPIDPSMPAERQSFLLKDSGLHVLITESAVREERHGEVVHVLGLQTDRDAIAAESSENPACLNEPDDLAYIIYTSGSTGQPKGVQIPHRNIVRLFGSTEPWYEFQEQDVWTMFHSYSFDFSVWEIWGALLYGGKLVVVPHWVSRSAKDFFELCVREGVTVLNQTPSAFRSFLRAAQEAGQRAQALRYVIFGGEALDLPMLKPWFSLYGDVQPTLVNMYGITETTVHVTYRVIRATDAQQGLGSLIGAPIPDLSLYVLDPCLQLVPVGVTGELYVSGAGVARGYLNRPDLTAERFLDNPFEPGEKLYRTGDLVRYLADGDLEYKGRIDHQVKIRGFRIELGEIEAHLLQHPQVQEAIVNVHADAELGKRLAAFVVMKDGAQSWNDLRRFLQDALPDYMIPSVWVRLDALPLNHNGKIDTNRLHHLVQEQGAVASGTGTGAEATTAAEQALVEIWEAVLKVEGIGIEDNFFALGGDSILSLRVLAEARKRGLNITVQDLFQRQNIRALAAKADLNTTESTVEHDAYVPFSLIGDEDRAKLPAGLEDAYPATLLQQGMLFHSEKHLDSPIYLNMSSYRLEAEFRLELWQEAIRHLLRRHPLLRTSFGIARYSEPLQLVHREAEPRVEQFDWRDLDEQEQQQRFEAWYAAEERRPFAWSEAPLVRFYLHRFSETEFQLSFMEHHAILDGWSVASMVTELLQTYDLLVQGEKPDARMPDPALYSQYVRLEKAALRDAEHQEFWKRELDGASVHQLSRTSTPERDLLPEMRERVLTWDSQVTAALQRVAVELQVPFKHVLLAAHLRVMQVLGGSQDLVTGLVANCRLEREDAEQALGVFLNTLPLRVPFHGGTWAELIRQAFSREQELVPHRRYPLVQIQQERGGQDLFEGVFNYTHFHVYAGLAHLNKTRVLDDRITAFSSYPFSANFCLLVAEARLELLMQWDATKVTESLAGQIEQAYQLALQAIVEDVQARYDQNPLLAEDELRHLLHVVNDTRVDYGGAQTLHEQFERQAALTPDAIAVEMGDGAWTYRELNEQANALAHWLQSEGVGPDVLVALCVERSFEMVYALLGVLKAGGAYLPIDPKNPADRIAYMLEDSKALLTLTQAKWADTLPLGTGSVWCIDSPALVGAMTACSKDNLPSRAGTADLAYIIYTSGSTGKPKGVMIEHRAILNHMLWLQAEVGFGPEDVCLQKTLFSFDASVWEFFAPLFVGGKLVLAPNEWQQDLELVIQAIVKHQVTVLQGVPSFLRAVLDLANPGELDSLRHVFSGGEALAAEVVDSFYEQVGQGKLYNFYGPTEATINATMWHTERERADSVIPIGSALANYTLYVLDAHLQPVPTGIPGELYIGGVGLSRGYLNKPELTAERFIPHPFGAPGECLYKTGDLVRWGADGLMEYIGRLDHQVKVRGYRIELGEIEAVLVQHPAVQQAVLMVREDVPGSPRLVAYLIYEEGSSNTPYSEIRGYLQSRLPSYMVPSAYLHLESFPKTPNGKLDLRALPQPGREETEDDAAHVAPQTEIELAVAAIWREVLGLPMVGANDNFFDLGGQSLLAVRVISRTREALNVPISMQSLFHATSLREFAADIEQLKEAAQPTVVESGIVSVADRTGLPLSTAQESMWFLEQLNPGTALYNSPLALRMRGVLDVSALQESLHAVITRHEILRTVFELEGAHAVRRVLSLPVLNVQQTDLTSLPEADRLASAGTWVMQEFQQPFDLAAGPLFRLRLIKLAEDDHVLVLTLHHIIFDGESTEVLLQEMLEGYEALRRGAELRRESPALQYADYAAWQRRWLQSDTAREQLQFWRSRLGQLPTAKMLNTDRPRPTQRNAKGEIYTYTIPSHIVQGLNDWSRQQSATLYVTLLAVFKILLHHDSRQQQIVVGTPVANRGRVELESLIGCFLNLVVLNTDLSGNPDVTKLVDRVRQTAYEAFQNQEMPFEKLVEELQPERSADQSPWFHVLFVLHSKSSLPRTLAEGLTLDWFPIEARPAKFDLHFDLEQTGDELLGSITYDPDVFNESTVAQLAKRYQALLSHLLEHPSATLEEMLAKLEAAEQEQLQSLQKKLQSTRKSFFAKK